MSKGGKKHLLQRDDHERMIKWLAQKLKCNYHFTLTPRSFHTQFVLLNHNCQLHNRIRHKSKSLLTKVSKKERIPTLCRVLIYSIFWTYKIWGRKNMSQKSRQSSNLSKWKLPLTKVCHSSYLTPFLCLQWNHYQKLLLLFSFLSYIMLASLLDNLLVLCIFVFVYIILILYIFNFK